MSNIIIQRPNFRSWRIWMIWRKILNTSNTSQHLAETRTVKYTIPRSRRVHPNKLMLKEVKIKSCRKTFHRNIRWKPRHRVRSNGRGFWIIMKSAAANRGMMFSSSILFRNSITVARIRIMPKHQMLQFKCPSFLQVNWKRTEVYSMKNWSASKPDWINQASPIALKHSPQWAMCTLGPKLSGNNQTSTTFIK